MKSFKLQNQGTNLSCYEWSVANPRKQLIIIHGLAEHAKRYDDLANHLNKNGISVFAMDLRGHGESIDDGLGIFHNKDGWLKVMEDIHLLYLYVRNISSETEIVLFGHSMGSIFARALLQKANDKYEKCILSGVTISKPGLRDVAPVIASIFPQKKPAKVLDDLTFGDFSKAFCPNRTKFDWLSRDKNQVDKYVADEKCGFVATGSMFKDVARTLLFTLKENNIMSMPQKTSIFIVSGENDPCGSFGYDAKYLADSYKNAGLNVEYKLYKNARHELVNEINNTEVYEDISSFILK